jgi:hypothetical protein
VGDIEVDVLGVVAPWEAEHDWELHLANRHGGPIHDPGEWVCGSQVTAGHAHLVEGFDGEDVGSRSTVDESSENRGAVDDGGAYQRKRSHQVGGSGMIPRSEGDGLW